MPWSSLNATREEPSAIQVTTIGLDLAKSLFQVHAVDGAGHARRADPAASLGFKPNEGIPWFSALGNH